MSRTSKKIWRQMDERALRRATDQVLSGGHHREILSHRWAHRAEQPPLMDAPSNGKVRAKGKCPKNNGGDHYPVHAKRIQRGFRDGKPWYGWKFGKPVVCLHCNKDLWNYQGPIHQRPEDEARITFRAAREDPWMVSTVDHYDRFNIRMRLLGLSCHCLACKSKD